LPGDCEQAGSPMPTVHGDCEHLNWSLLGPSPSLCSAPVAQAIFRETSCNLYFVMFLIKPGSFQ
jgi:hypothetical protein